MFHTSKKSGMAYQRGMEKIQKGYWINYYWTLFIQNEIKTME